MLGSYGPHPEGEAYLKNFDSEESPSGMLARMSTYSVHSRVVDDDGEVYAGELRFYVGKHALTYMNRLEVVL
jgi:Rho GDP-dissociation inhibitor